MEIVWSWKSDVISSGDHRLNLLQNDILHQVQFSAEQLYQYQIIKYPNQLPPSQWMVWDTPANIVPTPFNAINIFQETQTALSILDDNHSLQFLTGEHPTAKSHFMQLMWPMAQKSAQHSPFAVFAWYHQNQFIVFAFQDQKLLIANTYRVNNAQECLYFTLLPFHHLKMKPTELKVTLFADYQSPQGNQTKQVFSKLIPHTEFSNSIDHPIFTTQQPPMSHFVSFLINAHTCALPAEN